MNKSGCQRDGGEGGMGDREIERDVVPERPEARVQCREGNCVGEILL